MKSVNVEDSEEPLLTGAKSNDSPLYQASSFIGVYRRTGNPQQTPFQYKIEDLRFHIVDCTETVLGNYSYNI